MPERLRERLSGNDDARARIARGGLAGAGGRCLREHEEQHERVEEVEEDVPNARVHDIAFIVKVDAICEVVEHLQEGLTAVLVARSVHAEYCHVHLGGDEQRDGHDAQEIDQLLGGARHREDEQLEGRQHLDGESGRISVLEPSLWQHASLR